MKIVFGTQVPHHFLKIVAESRFGSAQDRLDHVADLADRCVQQLGEDTALPWPEKYLEINDSFADGKITQ